jgi:hypothetical protein
MFSLQQNVWMELQYHVTYTSSARFKHFVVKCSKMIYCLNASKQFFEIVKLICVHSVYRLSKETSHSHLHCDVIVWDTITNQGKRK